MEFEKPESSFGYCIFCEDIRQEVNNKLTFVGVYFGAELNVLGVLPAGIGKFCIQAMFKQRVADGLATLTFEVHMPGDDDDKPSARQVALAEQISAGLPTPPSDIEDPFFLIGMAIQVIPLEIQQEGKIQVSVVRNDKRYRLGQLKVRSLPPPSQNQEAVN